MARPARVITSRAPGTARRRPPGAARWRGSESCAPAAGAARTAWSRRRRARVAADMSASLVVGLAIRPAPEWVICAARRAAGTAW